MTKLFLYSLIFQLKELEANQSALESKIAALERAASQPAEDVPMMETEAPPAPAETAEPSQPASEPEPAAPAPAQGELISG